MDYRDVLKILIKHTREYIARNGKQETAPPIGKDIFEKELGIDRSNLDHLLQGTQIIGLINNLGGSLSLAKNEYEKL